MRAKAKAMVGKKQAGTGEREEAGEQESIRRTGSPKANLSRSLRRYLQLITPQFLKSSTLWDCGSEVTYCRTGFA